VPWGRRKPAPPPSAYINPSWRRVGHKWIKGVPHKSSPLHSPPCASPLPLSISCGSPKGCVGARATPLLYDKVLQEFWIGSKPIYFRNLGGIWIRKESWCAVHVRVLRGGACAALCRCTAAVALAPWRCGVEIFTTLRSATSASSSTHVRRCNPRDRFTRVRH
jgi:hypothetical protein